MQLTTANFIKGIIGSDPIFHDSLSQIAFVGRLNVGKSSLINMLTATRKLAISSSTPGRTLQIIFFLSMKKYILLIFQDIAILSFPPNKPRK